MSAERIEYRRLPGRRRGFFRGSGLWMGPDHLLLVRSQRFREEYRRFHLNDIQAISVAAAPRFHISTRSAGIATLWLIGLIIAWPRGIWAQAALWSAAAVLVGAWLYVSAACSCVCRIYTAVSRDDLPSLYRTWTARKFMARVQPRILEAQGTTGEDWAEALESRRIGPPELPPDVLLTGTASSARVPGARASVPLSELFVVLMLVDALFTFATNSPATALVTRIGYAIMIAEIALSTALLIQYSRGKLQAGMQKLVIVSLLTTGATWYGGTLVGAFETAAANNIKGRPAPVALSVPAIVPSWINDFDIGAHLLWGVLGIAIILAARAKQPHGSDFSRNL